MSSSIFSLADAIKWIAARQGQISFAPILRPSKVFVVTLNPELKAERTYSTEYGLWNGIIEIAKELEAREAK